MAGAWSFGELILSALDRATADAAALEKECVETLETSVATVYINGLRLAKVQNVCMIVGAFGLLEAEVSTLDAYRDARKPLQALISQLERDGKERLARRLWVLVKAVNVLKHGEGRSYSSLLGIQDRPSYLRVKARPDDFFCEGDVSEVPTLVDVDSAFVAAAVDVLSEVLEAIDSWACPRRGTEAHVGSVS